MATEAKPTNRMSTGVPGCDEVLGGGLLPGSYLLVGEAGAGKTIFSLHWLRDGAARQEPVMYITLAEPGTQIQRNVESFGWSLDGVEIVDVVPDHGALEHDAEEYHVFPPSEVENVPAWKAIYAAVKRSNPRRLVIDSLTQLRYLATDEYQFRKNVLRLVNYLAEIGCTTYFAFEAAELQRDASTGLAVDGIIKLGRAISPGLAIGLRSLQVDKLRGSDFMSGLHPMRIGADGIVVYPHRIEKASERAPGGHLASSGIAALDKLLGGGLESGTTTLLSGPTGAGKSTLGTQFLLQAIEKARAVLFSFEESPSFIATRSRNLGMPIDAALESGALKVVRVNPLELYPDEFLGRVRHAVEHEHCRMVMIDSLRGYQLAMEEFGRPQAHIHNLVSYLTLQGVTTLLINETEYIASPNLTATDIGVSHLADNIVLLRYAEHEARVIKVIACLKKRTGSFEPELRELRITPGGIQVSEPLQHLRGILTGIPTFAA